jgi:hypothetical protein
LSIALGLGLIGSIGYCAHGYGTAETRIRAVCDRIKPGMSWSELRTFATEQSLKAPTRETGVNYLVEWRTFGRYGCKVTLQNGVVRASEYNFAD